MKALASNSSDKKFECWSFFCFFNFFFAHVTCSNDLKCFCKHPYSLCINLFSFSPLLHVLLNVNFYLKCWSMHCPLHQLLLWILFWCWRCWLLHFKGSRTCYCSEVFQDSLMVDPPHIFHHQRFQYVSTVYTPLKCLNYCLIHSFFLTNLE